MLGFALEVIRGVLGKRRIDRPGLHERDPDRNAVVFEFHSERIGICPHGVLGRAVDAEQRRGAVRHFAAKIDRSLRHSMRICCTAALQPYTTLQKFVSKSLRLSSIG